MPRDSAFIRQLMQIWDANDIMAQPVTTYSENNRMGSGGQIGARGGKSGPNMRVGIGKGNLPKGGLGIGKGNLTKERVGIGKGNKNSGKRTSVDKIMLS